MSALSFLIKLQLFAQSHRVNFADIYRIRELDINDKSMQLRVGCIDFYNLLYYIYNYRRQLIIYLSEIQSIGLRFAIEYMDSRLDISDEPNPRASISSTCLMPNDINVICNPKSLASAAPTSAPIIAAMTIERTVYIIEIIKLSL